MERWLPPATIVQIAVLVCAGVAGYATFGAKIEQNAEDLSRFRAENDQHRDIGGHAPMMQRMNGVEGDLRDIRMDIRDMRNDLGDIATALARFQGAAKSGLGGFSHGDGAGRVR